MKRSDFRRWVAAGAIMLLGACAGAPKVGDWWKFTEADFRKLQPGKTTQKDVLGQLGEPFSRSTFERQGVQVWEYKYMDATIQMLAWVNFDREGRYTGFSAQPDPARYSSDSH